MGIKGSRRRRRPRDLSAGSKKADETSRLECASCSTSFLKTIPRSSFPEYYFHLSLGFTTGGGELEGTSKRRGGDERRGALFIVRPRSGCAAGLSDRAIRQSSASQSSASSTSSASSAHLAEHAQNQQPVVDPSPPSSIGPVPSSPQPARRSASPNRRDRKKEPKSCQKPVDLRSVPGELQAPTPQVWGETERETGLRHQGKAEDSGMRRTTVTFRVAATSCRSRVLPD
ncbi:hypothetical protein BDY21DRAFT_367791 [Lineolata rhizophorae]|uniref:Uncharacterized protein n=1 Tax=Lineolata rhizophorae TaxID=578093 RepID=A0A6A6NLB1_9PEZI|nr:hypothetical protein BDY21DRAFT_367791 [Lineolata rhizophorae]